MKDRPLLHFAILTLAPFEVDAQTLTIDHRPVGCVVAERFPRFDARFAPGESVAVARVLFRAEKSDQWWSVAMKAEGPSYFGVLPKPKKTLKALEYYLEVTDKALATTRTADYTASVVEGSGACSGKLLAGSVGSAAVLLQGPAGIVAAVPVGFASSGIVAAGSSSATAASGSAAAGGGGIGAGVLLAGAAAAAGVAVAVAPKGDSSNSSTPPVSTQTPVYDVAFVSAPQRIDVSVCAGGVATSFTGLAGIAPDSGGNFNELHSQLTPILRVAGQVTSTTFQATLTCANGAQSGSISATGANNSYSGTFVFGSQQGQVTVVKR